jgi:two-component system alkaline phosphatase synthesis response regulator PhoP
MTKPKTVLIIDDDSDFVRAIGDLLASAGYAVDSAANGRDGLRLAKQIEPDLIVLDVMMTERTEGFFTLQQIRSVPALRHTPVIVASSIYTDQPSFKVHPDARWLPADLFLPKPVDPARLIQESARLIGTPAASRAEASHAGSNGR